MGGTCTYGYKPSPLIGVKDSGQVDNTEIGFYGATPITQRTSTYAPIIDPGGWCIETAAILEELGLLVQAP